jgi:dTDP-4-amino-4,6-dideoxygalactose transaminase
MNFTVADAAVADLVSLLAEMPNPAGDTRVAALEHDLAARFGARHAVAVASGTAALHTALDALAIGRGDHVLVPALSVVMSVAPVLYAGARPIFVDCNPHGTDFDYDDLTAKITDKTRAVLPVHLWGRAGDPDRLGRIAADYQLDVIEDACQAQGTEIGGRPAGRHGTVGCFSMKDGKVLWSGEGGYLLTDDDEIAASARSFRSHCQPAHPAGDPPQLGHNYRLAEPLAVIARANLARFDDLLTRRQQQTHLLRDLVRHTPGIQVFEAPTEQRWNHYGFLANLTLPEPRAFCAHLAACGVPNSVGTFRLVPADQRPELSYYAGAPCRNAANVVDRILAVMLTDQDDDERITSYATTIAREAHQWRHHT